MNSFIDPNVPYIKLFGFEHILYVSIIISLGFVVYLNRNRLKHHQKRIRILLFTLSLFQQLLLYSWYSFMTNFDLSQALPLHLCRISTLLGLIYLVTLNSKLMDFVFYFGLFALGSFALPINIHPLSHALGISYIINHAITLLFPFIAWHAFDWRPHASHLKDVMMAFLMYFMISVSANTLFSGNYFYLTQRPFLKELPTLQYYGLTIIFSLSLFVLAYLFIDRVILEKEKDSTQ